MMKTADLLKLCLDEKDGLDNTIKVLEHFPSVPQYSELLKLKACDLISAKDDKAVDFLTNSHSISARHLALNRNHASLAKQRGKISNARDKVNESRDMFEDSEDESLPPPSLKQLSVFAFEKFDHMQWLTTLPEEWIIIQITELMKISEIINTAVGKADVPEVPDLAITRLACGQKVHPWKFPVVHLKTPADQKGTGTLGLVRELRELMAANATVSSDYRGNKEAYWRVRQEHHCQLKVIIDCLENDILGHWKFLLLGTLTETTDSNNLKRVSFNICDKLQLVEAKVTPETRHLFQLLLSSYAHLTRDQLLKGLSEILQENRKSNVCIEALKLVEKSAGDLKSLKNAKRNPVILVLDKLMLEFPWESMSVLSNNPVSRLPSMHMLRSLVVRHSLQNDSKSTKALVSPYVDLKLKDPIIRVDPKSGFYVINPGCDLDGLQQRLGPVVQKIWGTQGFAGQVPDEQKLKELLTNNDVYLYCGHGSGTKYLSGDQILRLENPAAPILMGCSSAKLASYGKELEPTGTAYSYLLAGSPCCVGMLWDVTDVDCDRFTLRFLDLWLGARKDETNEGNVKTADKNLQSSEMPKPSGQLEPEMLRAVAQSRGATKFVLTGGAAVVYGLPARAAIE